MLNRTYVHECIIPSGGRGRGGQAYVTGVLDYTEWRNFTKVIDKAKIACKNSGNAVSDHFVDVNKMVEVGSGAQREIDDIMLSRYACYLIVQNCDPRKEVIASGQIYFAVKTRERELQESFAAFTEEQTRLAIRNELKNHNSHPPSDGQDVLVPNTAGAIVFRPSGDF